MTLAEVLAAAAAGVPAAAEDQRGGGRVWSVAGRQFATLSVDGSTAEFALDPAVAAAAARTPDTVPSERGPGWISFRPVVADDHAADRARAWFLSAFRRAAG